MTEKRSACIIKGNGTKGAEETGIGTENERALHAALKLRYEPDPAYHEVPHRGYIADICRDGRIIEIQTGSFGAMRDKILSFTEEDDLTVVYPAIRHKWLVWVDPETGETTAPRRSPRTGSFYDIFRELVYISRLIGLERLHFRVILVDTEDRRLKNGWGKGGKRGSHRIERSPVSFGDELVLDGVEDFRRFIPDTLPRERFTVKQFARCASIQPALAGKAVNVLYTVGLIDRTGRDGRAYTYRVT